LKNRVEIEMDTDDKASSREGVFLGYPTLGAAWAVDFFFGNTEFSLGLWNMIAGISGFDD